MSQDLYFLLFFACIGGPKLGAKIGGQNWGPKIRGQNLGPKIGKANSPLGPQVPSALQTHQMFFNLSTFLSIAIENLGNILLRTVKLFKQLVICLSLFNN